MARSKTCDLRQNSCDPVHVREAWTWPLQPEWIATRGSCGNFVLMCPGVQSEARRCARVAFPVLMQKRDQEKFTWQRKAEAVE
jgi:hypothetical protein